MKTKTETQPTEDEQWTTAIAAAQAREQRRPPLPDEEDGWATALARAKQTAAATTSAREAKPPAASTRPTA